MLEKQIPSERLKPKHPCPACGKLFDDCECPEDLSDQGIVEMISSAFIFWLGLILFVFFIYFWIFVK